MDVFDDASFNHCLLCNLVYKLVGLFFKQDATAYIGFSVKQIIELCDAPHALDKFPMLDFDLDHLVHIADGLRFL